MLIILTLMMQKIIWKVKNNIYLMNLIIIYFTLNKSSKNKCRTNGSEDRFIIEHYLIMEIWKNFTKM